MKKAVFTIVALSVIGGVGYFGYEAYLNYQEEQRLQELERQRAARAERECGNREGCIKLGKVEWAYNTSSYKEPDETYYTADVGDYTGRIYIDEHTIRGKTITSVYGFHLKVRLNNYFGYTRTAKINVEAKSERVEEGAALGGYSYGGDRINDTFSVKVPSGGATIEKYFSTVSDIEFWGLSAAFSGNADKTRGSYLEAAPRVTLVSQ